MFLCHASVATAIHSNSPGEARKFSNLTQQPIQPRNSIIKYEHRNFTILGQSFSVTEDY